MSAGEELWSDAPGFVPVTVYKRDHFSETISGHLRSDPENPVVLRKLDGLHWSTRWIAWILARRETRSLRVVQGIRGIPQLIRVDRRGLMRTWIRGSPLQIAKPADAEWYHDAKRLLREMRRRGVTHNDLYKPQNWLKTPDGGAAVIDFQLSKVHRHRGTIFKTMAREDLRHLLKIKRAYAPGLLTSSERRMLAKKSIPSRIWAASGKRLYNFVTRYLNYADREGFGDRLTLEGPNIEARLKTHPGIRNAVVFDFAQPGMTVGLYAFAETDLAPKELRETLLSQDVDFLQPVAALPRDREGNLLRDALMLIAGNRIDEVALLQDAQPELRPQLAPIIKDRMNLSDRLL